MQHCQSSHSPPSSGVKADKRGKEYWPWAGIMKIVMEHGISSDMEAERAEMLWRSKQLGAVLCTINISHILKVQKKCKSKLCAAVPQACSIRGT